MAKGLASRVAVMPESTCGLLFPGDTIDRGSLPLQLHFSHIITSASNHTQRRIPNWLQAMFPGIGFCF